MIVERIFAHARSSPDRTAVITNGRPLSYLRFAGRICAVRGFLENQPVSPERVAVLCIHNIVDGWIIGLALRSLGVTTVHGRSLEDIKALELKEASLVSTTREIGTWSGLESLAAATGQPVITLPSDLLDDSAQPRIEGAATIGGAGFGGHIMLTSGTTGAFKKVLIDPRVEDTIIKARGALFGLTSASRVCLFDYGGWTVVGYHRPLSVWDAGAATIFHQGPERWRALAVPGVTIVHANEYYLTSVLEAPPEVSLRNDAMTLISGAGVLSSSHWRRARERLTNDVRATYGSTEAGLCGFTRIETADDLNWHHILPGYQVQVVDVRSGLCGS
jgi:acyl-coenzyme A synthetase/AMP-(fatty) acid ligase